ncbi:MarR family winged helix-turn-helix transcriptional regulator [Thalassotalea marina]|uniref:Transcriptional regulator n=1 Tax=Thalassotalea marina TaxID=1673741 RepID=A0A919BGK8_9GAMM|nr:MarR family winged helix-turn-helix transcriptional regulator [Thalassotalea marina]GHF89698.1 transcriptional regulator [Thalassotalea marina]
MKENIFNVIERLANLTRQEARVAGSAEGLQPVQQEALHFLSICNKYSDTPIAVTEYLGLTKGTVSQSLKVLESKGLIEKVKDEVDKRITHLKVTSTGLAFIASTSPPEKFTQAISEMPEQDQQTMLTLLKSTLRHYQLASGRKGFGVCKQCKFNQSVKDNFVCGLTEEPLSIKDVELICREYA